MQQQQILPTLIYNVMCSTFWSTNLLKPALKLNLPTIMLGLVRILGFIRSIFLGIYSIIYHRFKNRVK